MFISHKNNVIQQIHETEWQCRRMSKGLSKSEYWTWLDTITTHHENREDVVTYPSEDFTIVECIDENVNVRLVQLADYIGDGVYNIKYYTAKRDSEIEGLQSHFIGQDDTKDARLLANKWVGVRRRRDILIAETDYFALSDQTLSAEMSTYRQALRNVPTQSDPDNISWPTKP